MDMAGQLGVFFPKVASTARARRVEEIKKIKNERVKVAQKVDQAKAVVAPAPAPVKKAVSADGVVFRELLWVDGKTLFSVKIPDTAEYKVGTNGGSDYLRFCRPVKGGVVNIHMKIAEGLHFEVHQAMFGKKMKHVIQKRHAGTNVGLPFSINLDFYFLTFNIDKSS